MQSRLCVFVCVISAASCANILAVLPTLSKSHYEPIDVLICELARRGHNVTAITTFPQKTPVENLKDISVREARKVILNSFSIHSFSNVPETFFEVAPKFIQYLEDVEKIFKVQDVSDIISSNWSYDLIIYEMFNDDVFLGFAHKFKAPVITFSTCYMFPWVPARFGIPANPSYVPGFYSGGYSKNMNFYQRLRNIFYNLVSSSFFNVLVEPKISELIRKYFGEEAPPIHKLVKNISLYFINTHFTIFGAQPLPPQVVDISGIHLKPPKPLKQDLDRWLNESAEGVIYFSFGSMLRGATLPVDKVKAFLQVFESLPQRVLWKWEDDTVDQLPANVKIMKWLPQRDVLAHPKVKVFISHGGLLGTTEAVVSGVPILGIPMYGDQPNNVAALVENGVAVHVEYNNISVASLSYALNTLLQDKSYTENAKQLSRRFLDRPMSPLDTAVYWTEYVIRHRGAPHLQSAAVHLSWYQYYLLDVIAVLLAAVLVILSAVYYTVSSCLRLMCSSKPAKLKSN